MKRTAKSFGVQVERLLIAHLASLNSRNPSMGSIHRTTIRRFLSDFCQPPRLVDGRLAIDEPRLLQWLVSYAQGQSYGVAAHRLSALTRFLNSLASEGLIDANHLANFKLQHSKRGWVWIAQALQAPDPSAALNRLRSPPPVHGPLHDCSAAYIKLHRALGKQYAGPAQILRDLDVFLAGASISALHQISPDVMKRWIDTLPCGAHKRMSKGRLVSRFFDHLRSLGLLTVNPMTAVIAGARLPRSSFKPFIYTKDQIAAILAATKQLPKTGRFPLQAETCHTMVVLLYSLGLRHGEVRRFRVRDLDLAQQTLFINETKFHKSRYVPFGPKVGRCLQEYLQVRAMILSPLGENDPLFVSRWRKPVSHRALSKVFPKMLRQLGIKGIPGQRRPRIHDLRHTFAVHRLLRWYREGVDVQNRLPLLSTFMGHVNPRNTEVYLTITDDLLCEANTRFHRHFGTIFDKGNQL
jgi:integrase/recombinase XerD